MTDTATVLNVYEATRARDSAHVLLTATLREMFEAEARDDVGVHVQLDVTRAQAALVDAERALYHASTAEAARKAPAKGLGERQIRVLERLGGASLGRGDQPYPGYGWYYGSHAQTVKILDSLLKRGLVSRDENVSRGTFQITDVGRETLLTMSA